MTVRCTVCKNPGVRKVVDGYLEDGVTGAGVSRALAELGLNVSAEVINKHKTHYAPAPTREKGTRKADFAAIVRDKAVTQFEAGELDLRDKDAVPGISAGLKAQAIIDKREVGRKSTGTAELAFAIISMLRGEPVAPVAAIEDGRTIEGEFRDVTPQ